MTVDDLKRLHAHLRCIRDDPDGTLTAVQSYELALATRRVRDAIVEAEREQAARAAVIPSLAGISAARPGLVARIAGPS